MDKFDSRVVGLIHLHLSPCHKIERISAVFPVRVLVQFFQIQAPSPTFSWIVFPISVNIINICPVISLNEEKRVGGGEDGRAVCPVMGRSPYLKNKGDAVPSFCHRVAVLTQWSINSTWAFSAAVSWRARRPQEAASVNHRFLQDPREAFFSALVIEAWCLLAFPSK